ncbi:hypothetical protein L6452_15538 [Arctium lappa]|uniref:Uncharacterized protein n=1 Tax=Arctium lappa TaxID=4217 RepID=A0ACB9CPA2_ARCLA|nr:hypothetical protein L6452_15538 [Arctium lappa]
MITRFGTRELLIVLIVVSLNLLLSWFKLLYDAIIIILLTKLLVLDISHLGMQGNLSHFQFLKFNNLNMAFTVFSTGVVKCKSMAIGRSRPTSPPLLNGPRVKLGMIACFEQSSSFSFVPLIVT